MFRNQNVSSTHAAYSVVRLNKPKKLSPEDFLEKTFSEYLGCHPTYMIPLIRAHNYILRDLGPLNFAVRHYIGILAAARHRCTYLINFCKKEFLFNGGDPDWLKGLQYAPSKFRALSTINKLLAHQPWLFQKSHIEQLTKGPNPWSLSELTHAIIIMAHFHALCSLAFGCKFGFVEPENFDDEEGDYELVEIEELCFDAENGNQRIKKIVKRSPASRLIIERCRQLELENAQLAEFMKIKIRVRDAEKETNKERKKKNKQERVQNKKNKQQQQKQQQQQQKTAPVKVTGAKDNGEPKPGTSGGNDAGPSTSVASSSSSTSSTMSTSPSTSEKVSKRKERKQKAAAQVASGSAAPAVAGPSTSDKSNIAVPSTSSSQVASTSTAGPSTSAVVNNNKQPAAAAVASTSKSGEPTDKTVAVVPGAEAPVEPFKENTWSEDEWKKLNYGVLVDDGEFCYVDFASRGRPSEVSTFRYQDYQWDDQGYSLSNLLYPDIGPFLDEKFKVGYNLTYYTLGPKTNIDTSPFRRAIWNYIQCVYGMRHDDYNYREVNILLERHLKTFIKCLACYPETSVKHDFSAVMKGFRASEKIHVIIMVTEARLQTELLYALRSMTEYMKHKD